MGRRRCQVSVKEKETVRRKAKSKSNQSLWEKYRKLRRERKSLISIKRKAFYMSLPDLLKSSPKKFWSVFKNTSKQASVPNKMTWTRDETVETADNPSDISGLLN